MKLIIPPISDCFMPTLGVAQIAGYLKEKSVLYRVYDLNAELLKSLYEKYLHIIIDETINQVSEKSYSIQNIDACLNYHSLITGFELTRDSFNPGFDWKDSDSLKKFIEKEKVISNLFRRMSFLNDDSEDDYYGISISYESQVVFSFLLAKVIKESNPNAHICLGGSLLYNFSEEFYKLLFDIDLIQYFVIGKGEIPLEYIAKGQINAQNSLLSISIINGIYFIDSRNIEQQVSVYYPDYSTIDFSLYPSKEKAFPYMIREKCYYGKCAFCNGDRVNKNSERKDINFAFQAIMDIADSCGIYNVYIVDAALSPLDFKAISEMNINHRLKWIANARFEKALLDESLVAGLLRNGCAMLRFGFESGSQKVLNLMNKGTDVSIVGEILKLTHQYGIKNHMYIMFGYPGETSKDRQETIQFLSNNKQYITSYSVSIFQPIPNTKIYEELKKQVQDDDCVYERMLELIYEEKEYARLMNDIKRLTVILNEASESNIEYYSANIFNNEVKKEQAAGFWGSESIIQKKLKGRHLKHRVRVSAKNSNFELQQYMYVDLYDNFEIELMATEKLFRDILTKEGEASQEIWSIIENLSLMDFKKPSSKTFKYWIVEGDEKALRDVISIQFEP